jgi:hypothetical protein
MTRVHGKCRKMQDVAMTIARFTEQLSRALDDAHSDAQSLEALSVSGSSAKPWDFDVRDLLEHNDLIERLLHLCTSKSTMVPKRSLNCAWKLLTQATRSAPPAVAKRALDSAAGVVIAALHDVDVGTVSTSSECVHLAKFYAAQLVTLARNNTVAAFRTGVGAPKTDTLSRCWRPCEWLSRWSTGFASVSRVLLRRTVLPSSTSSSPVCSGALKPWCWRLF